MNKHAKLILSEALYRMRSEAMASSGSASVLLGEAWERLESVESGPEKHARLLARIEDLKEIKSKALAKCESVGEAIEWFQEDLELKDGDE